MVAEPIQFRAPRGRPSTATLLERVQQLRAANADLRAELLVRAEEAGDFVAEVRPLAHRLELATQFIGPAAHQHAIRLLARLESFETRWASRPKGAA